MATLKRENGKIRGEIFIIPNHMPSLGQRYLTNSTRGAFIDFCIENGMGFNQGSQMIEVWATSPDCGNWCDHDGTPEGWEPRGEKRWFPHTLPADLFAGKKEGDVVAFRHKGVEVELTLAQTKYRYKNHGTFEEVLKEVTL